MEGGVGSSVAVDAEPGSSMRGVTGREPVQSGAVGIGTLPASPLSFAPFPRHAHPTQASTHSRRVAACAAARGSPGCWPT